MVFSSGVMRKVKKTKWGMLNHHMTLVRQKISAQPRGEPGGISESSHDSSQKDSTHSRGSAESSHDSSQKNSANAEGEPGGITESSLDSNQKNSANPQG